MKKMFNDNRKTMNEIEKQILVQILDSSQKDVVEIKHE